MNKYEFEAFPTFIGDIDVKYIIQLYDYSTISGYLCHSFERVMSFIHFIVINVDYYIDLHILTAS